MKLLPFRKPPSPTSANRSAETELAADNPNTVTQGR